MVSGHLGGDRDFSFHQCSARHVAGWIPQYLYRIGYAAWDRRVGATCTFDLVAAGIETKLDQAGASIMALSV